MFKADAVSGVPLLIPLQPERISAIASVIETALTPSSDGMQSCFSIISLSLLFFYRRRVPQMSSRINMRASLFNTSSLTAVPLSVPWHPQSLHERNGTYLSFITAIDKTGPHIMIVGADAGFYDSYPLVRPISI